MAVRKRPKGDFVAAHTGVNHGTGLNRTETPRYDHVTKARGLALVVASLFAAAAVLALVRPFLLRAGEHLLPPAAWEGPNRRQHQVPPSQALLAVLRRADGLAEQGDSTQASAAYIQYLEESAHRGERVSEAAHFNAAATFSAVGDFDRADRHYSFALGADPKSASSDRASDVAAGMAITASRRGDSRQSVRRWREALSFRPLDANLKFALGRELERVGDDESLNEALTHLRAAAVAQPSSPRFHFFLGVLTSKLYGADAAKEHFSRALAVPADTGALHELALETADEHPEHALAFFAKAVDKTKSRMHARAIVYAWGRTLADFGRDREEQALYADAARGGILADARQRPLVLDAALIPASPWPDADVLNALRPAIELLESNADAIR